MLISMVAWQNDRWPRTCGFHSRRRQNGFLLFTQLPFECILGSPCPVIKQPEHVGDQSPPPRAQVTNMISLRHGA